MIWIYYNQTDNQDVEWISSCQMVQIISSSGGDLDMLVEFR